LLINHRGALRLIDLVLLPELPAEHQHQGDHGTQHKRLAVALPPVFDLRQLFFFSTRGHAVTPFIR